jgi:hypothetical protein
MNFKHIDQLKSDASNKLNKFFTKVENEQDYREK